MSLFEQNVISDVIARLKAAGDDRDFEAAQMQLINLPEIIAGAGPHWPTVKEKLRTGSVSFLKACLDEGDAVVPAGDGFLIIFGAGEPDVLKQRAEELRGLLLEFYLSQEGLRKLGISLQHKRISAHELRALLSPPAQPTRAPTAHTLVFAPIWSPGAAMIASYACMPVYEARDGQRCGYDKGFADNAECAHRDYCELDISALDMVEQAFERYSPEQAMPAIGLSVHSTTLQHRALRQIYFDRLGRFAPWGVKHVFLKIAEIEPGAPMINLADWVGMLRARVRNVLLEFHFSEQNPPSLTQIGAWGAGFQAPLAANREGADTTPVARHFKRWGEAIQRQRARFFVDNLRRPGLIGLAAEAGAHFVTSDPYWPFRKWPGAVVSANAPSIPHFSPARKPLTSATS